MYRIRNSFYLWPLFVDDVEEARKGLKTLWGKGMIDTKQAAHWGLNLGDRQWVNWLIKNKGIEIKDTDLKGIEFRLKRGEGNQNPYESIIHIEPAMRAQVLEIAKHGYIILNGGIGDHIEDVSMLLPWYRKNKVKLRVVCTKERTRQLRRFFTEVEVVSKAGENNAISSKLILSAMGKDLPEPGKVKDVKIKQADTSDKKIMCCWTAIGDTDKLSQWTRSVPFKDVLEFYKDIVEKGLDSSEITDCSNWKQWECNILKEIGIKLYEPKKGDVLKFAEEANKYRIVISIDTALAHICAAINKDVKLLLPKYNDERWFQLLRGGSSYNKTCKIIKQTIFGKWSVETKGLLKMCISELVI